MLRLIGWILDVIIWILCSFLFLICVGVLLFLILLFIFQMKEVNEMEDRINKIRSEETTELWPN